MPDSAARAGLTLPIWLTAAALAALDALVQEPFRPQQPVDPLEPGGPLPVPVRAAALLQPGLALGETCCDPGDGLDLTRGLVVWVLARWLEPATAAPAGSGGTVLAEGLTLEPGEGVGVLQDSAEICLSGYARRLLAANLGSRLPQGRHLALRVVLPAGRSLARRTSNAAFGVVEGLALIGTQAAVQAGAGPDQLAGGLEELRRRCAAPGFGGDVVLVIGENGLDLAPRLGVPPELLLKAGNWLGPLLVAAADQGVRRLLLFGYQGKLIKLAGGIFHTHHHLADGRAEILTAWAALEGLHGPALAALHRAGTTEAALRTLEEHDADLAERLRQRLAARIEERAVAYLERHGMGGMTVGAVLFDRSRRVCARGPAGGPLLEAVRRAA